MKTSVELTTPSKIAALAAITSVPLMAALALTRAIRSRRTIDFRGRSVLVTGGSRGLGLVVARELGRQGARLTLAARDQEELERARDDLAARGVTAHIVICDVSKSDQVSGLVDGVVRRSGRIDVLINNAGVIQVGPLDHMSEDDFDEALAVHFWAPLRTMLAAIPHMRRQRGGRIVNVSSIGGRIGVPHLVPYCASKFALTGLSQSMQAELARDGIYITTVSPGLMRTGSPFNAWFKGRHRDEFRWFAISSSLPLITVDAERAARLLIEACRRGDPELVIGWPAKSAVVLKGLLPSAVARVMRLANDLMLPNPDDLRHRDRHKGWESLSWWAPSTLTTLADRAASRNNEVGLDHPTRG
jgi:NAD(P)-dependent dehydrogenase (short-subunit alcohol dehydrogenase family)